MDYSHLTPEQIRRIRAHYYAKITHVDRQVGKLSRRSKTPACWTRR